jgi:hypothetical protein
LTKGPNHKWVSNGTSSQVELKNDNLGQINQGPNKKGHGQCTY